MAAIQDLGRLSSADHAIAIRALNATLVDEDSEVRAASVVALGGMGFRAVETGSDGDAVVEALNALIGLLKDREPHVRAAAANSLGAISSAKAPGVLDTRASNHPPGGTNARPALAGVVAAPVGTKSVIAALEQALGDREASVRGAAAFGLAAASSKFEPPSALAAMLEDESAENRVMTVRTVARYPLGLDWWIPLLVRMAENDRDRSVRADVPRRGSFTRSGRPRSRRRPSRRSVAGLRSRDLEVRKKVAHLLGRMGPEAEAAIPPLLRVLTQPVGDSGADESDENVNLAGARLGAGKDRTRDGVEHGGDHRPDRGGAVGRPRQAGRRRRGTGSFWTGGSAGHPRLDPVGEDGRRLVRRGHRGSIAGPDCAGDARSRRSGHCARGRAPV